jgi:hypothetical protein
MSEQTLRTDAIDAVSAAARAHLCYAVKRI